MSTEIPSGNIDDVTTREEAYRCWYEASCLTNGNDGWAHYMRALETRWHLRRDKPVIDTSCCPCCGASLKKEGTSIYEPGENLQEGASQNDEPVPSASELLCQDAGKEESLTETLTPVKEQVPAQSRSAKKAGRRIQPGMNQPAHYVVRFSDGRDDATGTCTLVAKTIGVSTSTLSRWCSGSTGWRAHNVKSITKNGKRISLK